MILKGMILGVVFSVAWINHAQGVSFSKVHVQSGGGRSDPVDFVKYGAPGVYTDAQIARLSAPPIGSLLPVQSVANVIPPCVSPCVLPSQNIASAVPYSNNAKIVTYNSPSVPVVVAPSNDNGYEYSYVVYDETTGDQKAQRESSDGAVVRGEYSFIQPDGYVREVQYTADDISGFNAVVKKILPDSIGKENKNKKKPEHKEKKEPAPCADIKKEAIKAPESELVENVPHDIEVNVAKPEPTKAPEKKAEAIKEPEQKPKAIEGPPKAPEPEQPKTTVLPLKEEKREETHKAIKEPTASPAPAPPASAPPKPEAKAVVAYDDIIRCLQSRIQRPQGPLTANISPLTYIILPGGPC